MNDATIQDAIKRKYPLMGFSSWHHLVGNLMRYKNQSCNAVIVVPLRDSVENIVIKGDPFPDSNYFHPHTIAFERSKRYPNGKHIKLEPFTIPSEIARQIWVELY